VDSGSGLVFADIDGAYVHAGGDLVITLTDDADEFIIADAIRVQRLSPLQAAAGESATAAVANLNQGDVTEVFQTAVAIWTATVLTSEQSELLAAVTFDVRDLADGHLGAASTSAIFLDINGAGYGWFVDSTPLVNEEFQFVDGSLSAIPGGPADGQIDLLTVVLHELGHVIGLGDLPSASAAGNLMSENISTSLRRLPAGTGSSTSSSLPAAQPPISSSSDNSTAAGLNGLLETPLVGHHTPAELYADRQDDDVLEPGTQPANTRLSDDEADGIDTVFSFLTQENNQNNQSPFDQI
jgi:hypothetical protein